ILVTPVYMAYVLVIDRRIQQLLLRLAGQFKRYHESQRRMLTLLTTGLVDTGAVSRTQTNPITTRCQCDGFRFQLYEITIYREYYSLRFYHLCWVDLRLLLKAGCFVLVYFVLTIQTD